PIDSDLGCVRGRVHDEMDVGLEEMPAYLAGGRLQILLAVMQATRRGVEGRVGPVRRLPGQHAEYPGRERAPSGNVLSVECGEPVVTAEELAVEQTDCLRCTPLSASPGWSDADGNRAAQILRRLHG